jgi:hypothetical protein
MMLAWQRRADTQEHQLAVLQTRLHEEVRAKEALAQQVATLAALKPTPLHRKQQEAGSVMALLPLPSMYHTWKERQKHEALGSLGGFLLLPSPPGF